MRSSHLNILLSTLLMALLSACTQAGSTPTHALPPAQQEQSQPPAPGEAGQCGDGVCKSPETAKNCPQDCGASPAVAQDAGSADQPQQQGEVILGSVFASTELNREGGQGTCGVEPWLSDDCSEPKFWWGLHLAAAISTYVVIIPDGENRWVVTNQADEISGTGFDPGLFNGRDGYYKDATIDFSSTPGCSGSITGQQFSMPVRGTIQNGRIELILSAEPHEIISGTCGSAAVNQDLTILMYGWSAALSGDPLVMAGSMGSADLTSEAGVYRHEYSLDTNPSPQNRDQVAVTLELWCVEQVEGGANPIACPWD
jgi:hypothetical protein